MCVGTLTFIWHGRCRYADLGAVFVLESLDQDGHVQRA